MSDNSDRAAMRAAQEKREITLVATAAIGSLRVDLAL